MSQQRPKNLLTGTTSKSHLQFVNASSGTGEASSRSHNAQPPKPFIQVMDDEVEQVRSDVAPSSRIATTDNSKEVKPTTVKKGFTTGLSRTGTFNVERSSLFAELDAFFPVMQKANADLMERVAKEGTDAVSIEHVDASEGRHINMDLTLGIFDVLPGGGDAMMGVGSGGPAGGPGSGDIRLPGRSGAHGEDGEDSMEADAAANKVANALAGRLLSQRAQRQQRKRRGAKGAGAFVTIDHSAAGSMGTTTSASRPENGTDGEEDDGDDEDDEGEEGDSEKHQAKDWLSAHEAAVKANVDFTITALRAQEVVHDDEEVGAAELEEAEGDGEDEGDDDMEGGNQRGECEGGDNDAEEGMFDEFVPGDFVPVAERGDGTYDV